MTSWYGGLIPLRMTWCKSWGKSSQRGRASSTQIGNPLPGLKSSSAALVTYIYNQKNYESMFLIALTFGWVGWISHWSSITLVHFTVSSITSITFPSISTILWQPARNLSSGYCRLISWKCTDSKLDYNCNHIEWLHYIQVQLSIPNEGYVNLMPLLIAEITTVE